MVDVIRRAKLKCTCPKCLSELEYTHEEITGYKINQDYLGDFDLIKGIKCPVCETIIKVK